MANDPSQSDPLIPADDAAGMVFVPGSGAPSAADTSSEPGQRRNRVGQKAESSHSTSGEGNRRVDKPKSSNPASHDDKLVNQTKQQIRQLVSEISELARTDCSVQDFYQGFLTRTTGALASEGGAIWIRESSQQPLKIHYHINLKQTVLANDTAAQRKHLSLIHISEPTRRTPISYAVFCLKKKK